MKMMNFYSYVSLPEGSEGKYSNTPHKGFELGKNPNQHPQKSDESWIIEAFLHLVYYYYSWWDLKTIENQVALGKIERLSGNYLRYAMEAMAQLNCLIYLSNMVVAHGDLWKTVSWLHVEFPEGMRSDL